MDAEDRSRSVQAWLKVSSVKPRDLEKKQIPVLLRWRREAKIIFCSRVSIDEEAIEKGFFNRNILFIVK